MANARIARFISEVAPPQFVSVMRRRTAKVLDTIKEEERDVCANIDLSHVHNTAQPKSIPSATQTIGGGVNSKYLLKEVQRPFSIFNH